MPKTDVEALLRQATVAATHTRMTADDLLAVMSEYYFLLATLKEFQRHAFDEISKANRNE